MRAQDEAAILTGYKRLKRADVGYADNSRLSPRQESQSVSGLYVG
jgi:hypothetical protein